MTVTRKPQDFIGTRIAYEQIKSYGYTTSSVKKALSTRDAHYAYDILTTLYDSLTLKEQTKCVNIIVTSGYIARRLLKESRGKYDHLLTSVLWVRFLKKNKIRDYNRHINFGVKSFKRTLHTKLTELDYFTEDALRDIVEENYKSIAENIIDSLNRSIIKNIIE